MSAIPIKITRREYERIKRFASFDVIKTDKEKIKDELRKKSKAREATWGNTLSAQRKAKFQARIDREARLEAERVRLDEIEAAKRRDERAELINRANRLMYEQRDEIKSFRSKQMQADILEHNSEQLGERQWEIDEHNAREAYFHRETMRQIKEGEERDRAEREEREAKAKWFAAEQQNQLKERTQRHVDRLVQERLEGKLVVEKALADLEEEKRKIAEARRRARQNNMEMKQENQRLQGMREAQKKELAKEMDKIKAFADERDRKTQQRKDHRAKMQAIRQAAQQRMIDRAVEHLNRLNTDEGARLESQVAEADAKNNAMLKARDDARAAHWRAIDKSRQGMIVRKQRLKEEEREADKRIAKQWRAETAAVALQARREKEELRRRGLELQAFVGEQREQERARKIKAREDDLARAREVRRQRKKDEKAFRATMEGELDKYRSAGKNITQMVKCMEPRNELKGFVFY
jgi:hypothetical protein